MAAQLQLPLFQIINEARSTYGLRHQDYTRYQNHCTKKVAHLRKSVGLCQVSGGSKNRKYAKKEVTESSLKSDKHLQILLFDAERSWAHSQAIKATLSSPSVPPSRKHDVTRRLSRAILASAKLLAFSSHLGPSQHGQIMAYNLILRGTHSFEQQKFEEGLKTLSLANELLGKLADGAKEARDEALVNELIDEVEPMLRFCAYSLEYDTSQGVGSIAEKVVARLDKEAYSKGYTALIEELDKEGKANGDDKERVQVAFRGRDIPIRNSQLVQAIGKVQSSIKSLEAAAEGKQGGGAKGKGKKETMGVRKMNAFDKALLVIGEAEDLASQLVEDNKIALSSTNSSRSSSSSSPLLLAHSYLSYTLLTTRISRDLLLISSTSSSLATRLSKIAQSETTFVAQNGTRDPKIREEKERKAEAKVLPGLVRLLDGVVMSLESLREVSLVEEDGELAAEVESRIALARAKRCFYLSKSYALLSKYPDSLSLSTRAKLYLRESRSISQSLDSLPTSTETDLVSSTISSELSLEEKDLNKLENELEVDMKRVGGDWFVFSGGKFGEEVGEEVELMEGLDLDGKKKKKAGKNGEAEKKEKFYDVAFSYVTAFDLDKIKKKAGLVDDFEEAEEGHEAEEEEAVDEKDETAGGQQKKGWGFGLFGRK